MANNGVSQHFKIDKGLDLVSDSQFATLGANTKIVYKPNSEKYVKNPNYSNVFDKAKSFATDEELSGVSTELGTVKSKSITVIDDANGNGVCSCKNASGTQVDTFTCHVSKSASNPTLSWGSTATIGTIDGTAFKVTMPANPDTKAVVVNNAPILSWGQTSTVGSIDGTSLTVTMPANPNTDTKYSAGTGLTLSGTTFSISQGLIDKISDSLPIGSYIQFAGSQAPAGFLVCNGGAVSRTTYSKLFAVIGTIYGGGNGSTTFNLPNLIDRFLQGSSTSGVVKNAGLPDITGSVTGTGAVEEGATYSGAFYYNGLYKGADGGDDSDEGFGFKASRSNSIYGNSSTVQPPALTCLICIKY